MKLQKQWKHWVRKAGLRTETKRGQFSGFYLIGRGRRWRVNCYGEFECSCPVEHFDRWENSRGYAMNTTPKTEAEFIAAVGMMRDLSKDAR